MISVPTVPSALAQPSRLPERLLTMCDLAALPAELPTGSVRYELDNGRLIIMPPSGDPHGSVEAKFTGAFLYEGERRGHGKVWCGEIGIVLWQNPDRVVGADAIFIAKDHLPVRRSPEGYLLTIPDLVVEVLGKNDSFVTMEPKVKDYLKAGVLEVWVADPASRCVLTYRKEKEPIEYSGSDCLAVEDIIPGLRLSVAEVFGE